MKKKKIIKISVFIMFCLIFISFITTLTKQYIYNKSLTKSNKNDKYLLVKYTLSDRNQLPEDATIDDMWKDHFSSLYIIVRDYIKLEKQGDYYVADFNYVNKKALGDISEVTFALNNNNGVVIPDAVFDKENFKAKIPASYYKQKEKESDTVVQVQILSRTTKEDINKVKYNYSKSSLLAKGKTKSKYGDIYDLSVSIPVIKKTKSRTINKEDIELYINGEKYYFNDDNSNYHKNSGTLEIQKNPLLINNVEVKINKKNIFTNISNKILGIDPVKASSTITYANMAALGDLGDMTDSDIDELVEGYPYYFGGSAYSEGGTVVQLQGGGSTGVITSITAANVPSSLGLTSDQVNKLVTGYNESYTHYLYGSDAATDDPAVTIHNAAVSGNSITDGTIYKDSGGNATRAMQLPQKIWWYKNPWDTYEKYDVNLRNAWSDYDGWVSLYCGHVSSAITPSADETSFGNWIAMSILKKQETATGGWFVAAFSTYYKYGDQTGYGVYKFTYTKTEDTGGYITITKKFPNAIDVNQAKKIAFTAQKTTRAGSCDLADRTGTKYHSTANTVVAYSYDSGTGTFDTSGTHDTWKYYLGYNKSKNKAILPIDTTSGTSYCVWEQAKFYNDYKVTWTEGDNHNVSFTSDGKTIPAVIVKFDQNTTTSSLGFEYEKTSATNDYYCLTLTKLKKGTTTKLDGVGFQLYSDSACTKKAINISGNEFPVKTTDSSGQIVFNKLEPKKYYIKETNEKTGYWNDHQNCTELGTATKDCPNKNLYDSQKYYCAKVVKKDVTTNTNLAGATFTTSRGTMDSNAGAAVRYVFTGSDNSNIRITETVPPTGYSLPNPSYQDVKPALLKPTTNGTEAEARTLCLGSGTDAQKFNGDSVPATAVITFNDSKYLLNWYKETEKGYPIGDAEFKVSHTVGSATKYLKVSNTPSSYTVGGVTRNCYGYINDDQTEATASIIKANSDGTVCISGVSTLGDYLVTETKPAKYHTFDGTTSKTIPSATSFVNISNTKANVFTNKPTEVKITKKVENEENADAITKLVNDAAKKNIRFTISDAEGNIYFFATDYSYGNTGKYVYYWRKTPAGNIDDQNINERDLPLINNSLPSYSETTKDLYLDNNYELDITHLPAGTYIVREYGATVDNDNCVCTDGANECVPFYHLKSETKFTVSDCSSEDAKNLPVCANNSSKGRVEVTITNKLTELIFTKKDLYEYGDSDDVNGDAVEFEDNKERSDFDRIVFKVYKDSDTNRTTPLKFIKIGNNITDNTKVCLSDSDYSIYRYVPDEVYNTLTEEQKAQVVTELHTCGGHIKILGLCRGQKFVVVEDQVPDDSVYVLETDPNGKKPEVSYTIECCDTDKPTIETTTTIIKDTPTRVRIEKRDSKYNFLINDENTTFELYQCEKGHEEECHPSQSNEHMTLVKFHPRAVITNDQEDGGTDDYENSYMVYRKVSDTDAKNMSKCSNGESGNNCYVTDLHTDHGVLVLRYLQSGYTYKLLETGNPSRYTLPEGLNRETKIEVVNNTANVEPVDYPNIPTSLLVRKYNEDGTKLLEGAEFKIYNATSCSTDVAPKNLVGSVVKLRTIRDGMYENRTDGDTEIFKTCTDRDGALCSGINDGLTHDNYKNTDISETFGDYTNVLNSEGEHPVIQAGEALIEYLDYGCYVIEEVKAPKGYKLPENENDRFIFKQITNKQEVVDTFKELLNKPTHYTFYKLDEYNKPLDGAKFKLQKLNSDKKYEDVPVTMETGESGKTYYRVDDTSTNYIIETVNGEGTVYYLSEGQYRILEVVPPEGYELPAKSINAATFVVDENGQIFGGSVITNKPKTEKINAYAEAKLIINIQTGQTILKYGLIIAIIVIVTCGLIYIQRKKK